MAWRFTSDRPVYIQIAERMTMSVLSGEYAPGEQIPTVRQLAEEAAVNPNTVQRAFSELENSGIVVSKGTLGRFVTEEASVIDDCRNRMAKNIVAKFVENLGSLSIPEETAIEMIKEAYL